MAEAMSDARLAEIRDEVTGPCSCCGYDKHDFDEPYALELLAEVERLRAHLVAEHLAAEAAETENDALRAQLAEIGETREEWEEWAVRWPTAGGDYAYELCEDEQDAREAIPDDDDTCEIVKHVVGDWQQVER